MIRRRWWLATVGIIGLVFAASVFASDAPDGLESVADELGFAGAAQQAPFDVLADYAVVGLDGDVSTALAGLVGIVVVVAIVWLLGRLLVRRRVDGAGSS